MKAETELQKFDKSVDKVLSVSHAELQRREENWKKRRAARKRAIGKPRRA
jgi:hypothetical protein